MSSQEDTPEESNLLADSRYERFRVMHPKCYCLPGIPDPGCTTCKFEQWIIPEAPTPTPLSHKRRIIEIKMTSRKPMTDDEWKETLKKMPGLNVLYIKRVCDLCSNEICKYTSQAGSATCLTCEETYDWCGIGTCQEPTICPLCWFTIKKPKVALPNPDPVKKNPYFVECTHPQCQDMRDCIVMGWNNSD
jgi:hypothetical protein